MVQECVDQCATFVAISGVGGHAGWLVDYDQIVVLEQGKLVEIGAPGELLEKVPAGPFARLVEETGDNQSAHLR